MKTIEVKSLIKGKQIVAGYVKTVSDVTGAKIKRVKGGWTVSGDAEEQAAKYLECGLQQGGIDLEKPDDQGDLSIIWVPDQKMTEVLRKNADGGILLAEARWKWTKQPLNTKQIAVFGPLDTRIAAILTTAEVLGGDWLKKVGFYEISQGLKSDLSEVDLGDHEVARNILNSDCMRMSLEGACGCVVRCVGNTAYFYGEERNRKAGMKFLKWGMSGNAAEGDATAVVDTNQVEIPEDFITESLEKTFVYRIADGDRVCMVSCDVFHLKKSEITLIKYLEKTSKNPFITSTLTDQKSPLPVGTDTFHLAPPEIPRFPAFKKKIDESNPAGHLALINNVMFILGTKEYRKEVRHAFAEYLEEMYKNSGVAARYGLGGVSEREAKRRKVE